MTEQLGIDSFQADDALAADFSAVRREEAAQHLRTISSLIERTVGQREHGENTASRDPSICCTHAFTHSLQKWNQRKDARL